MDETERPLDLPLLPTYDDTMYVLLLPGLRRGELKDWEYDIDEENDQLVVRCYYGGLGESGEIDGMLYPVKLNETRRKKLEDLETLLILNPLEVDLEDYFETERADEARKFFKQLELKYGRDLPAE